MPGRYPPDPAWAVPSHPRSLEFAVAWLVAALASPHRRLHATFQACARRWCRAGAGRNLLRPRRGTRVV